MDTHSEAIILLNNLISAGHRVQNAEEELSSGFLEKVVQDLESEIKTCDVVLSENIMSKEDLEEILLEYENQKRNPGEIAAGNLMNEKDAKTIIAAMKGGLGYSKEDSEDSYVDYWKYDSKKDKFIFQKIDTIVGYMPDATQYTESEFRLLLMQNFSYTDFMSETYKSNSDEKI